MPSAAVNHNRGEEPEVAQEEEEKEKIKSSQLDADKPSLESQTTPATAPSPSPQRASSSAEPPSPNETADRRPTGFAASGIITGWTSKFKLLSSFSIFRCPDPKGFNVCQSLSSPCGERSQPKYSEADSLPETGDRSLSGAVASGILSPRLGACVFWKPRWFDVLFAHSKAAARGGISPRRHHSCDVLESPRGCCERDGCCSQHSHDFESPFAKQKPSVWGDRLDAFPSERKEISTLPFELEEDNTVPEVTPRAGGRWPEGEKMVVEGGRSMEGSELGPMPSMADMMKSAEHMEEEVADWQPEVEGRAVRFGRDEMKSASEEESDTVGSLEGNQRSLAGSAGASRRGLMGKGFTRSLSFAPGDVENKQLLILSNSIFSDDLAVFEFVHEMMGMSIRLVVSTVDFGKADFDKLEKVCASYTSSTEDVIEVIQVALPDGPLTLARNGLIDEEEKKVIDTRVAELLEELDSFDCVAVLDDSLRHARRGVKAEKLRQGMVDAGTPLTRIGMGSINADGFDVFIKPQTKLREIGRGLALESGATDMSDSPFWML